MTPGALSICLSLCQCHIVLFTKQSVVTHFEIKKYKTSNFVLFYFGHLGSVEIAYEFRIDFSLSAKNCTGILIGIAIYLKITLVSIDILIILNL